MGAFAFWAVFLLLVLGLTSFVESLFPHEVDAIMGFLGFGGEPQWRR